MLPGKGRPAERLGEGAVRCAVRDTQPCQPQPNAGPAAAQGAGGGRKFAHQAEHCERLGKGIGLLRLLTERLLLGLCSVCLPVGCSKWVRKLGNFGPPPFHPVSERCVTDDQVGNFGEDVLKDICGVWSASRAHSLRRYLRYSVRHKDGAFDGTPTMLNITCIHSQTQRAGFLDFGAVLEITHRIEI